MKLSAGKKNVVKTALVLAAMIVFAASCLQPAQREKVLLTAAETPDPIVVRVSDSKFDKFSHKVPEHQQFQCISCHRREGKSRELEFAAHNSCIGCHLNQFIDKQQAMCAICHQDMSETPTMQKFPARFIEGFNMKFDHAAHETGKGRPAAGCAFCHAPSGPGQTIPSGIDTHANCYTCHTAESKIGSCTVCHELAPYGRTLQSRYNFKAIFRHGDHRGESCSACHNVIAGAGQGRQVTNINILEHRTSPGNNCLQCHNGRRAFTGNVPSNVASCSRCHVGLGSTKLPEGTYPDDSESP